MTVYQWTLQLPDSTTPLILTLEAESQAQEVPLKIEGDESDIHDFNWDYWDWASDPYGHGLDLEGCRPEDLHFALSLDKFAPLKPRYLGPEMGPWTTVPPDMIS